jgi:hypothetical protein
VGKESHVKAQDSHLPFSYTRARLVDKKGSLLGNRWFLGTAIKSWLRAGPYPVAHKQKDAAPKGRRGRCKRGQSLLSCVSKEREEEEKNDGEE